MRKKILIPLIFIIVVFTVLIIMSRFECKNIRKEARCEMGIENYKKYLKYQNFKNSRFNTKRSKNDVYINLEILADMMHIYNKECKEYNATEDKIIDNNLERVAKEFGIKINKIH